MFALSMHDFPQKGGKIFNDPIHGHIEMPPYCIAVIDTPQFQRLRDLKQLGATYLTFPGASHNRFEHSLGVGHLAGALVNSFAWLSRLFLALLWPLICVSALAGLACLILPPRKKRQEELGVTTRDIRNVTIAGLIHDLGHGPFSHSFEKWMSTQKSDVPFHHEDMSKRMFRYLIEDNYLDIEEDDVQFIEELVCGNYSAKNAPKAFMFEIVANNKNSVDVDKFDYLARDCYNCGIKSAYDFSRLMLFSRVINNEICYHSKEGWTLNLLFNTRYSLFKQVYSHRVGNAIDYMIGDAFTLADPILRISERAKSPETYTYLTDCLLKEIESSQNPDLIPAQNVIRRIRRRELYSFADEFIIPWEEKQNWKIPTSEELITYQETDGGVQLNANDIIVEMHTNNYALKDKNPIEHIHFFNKWDSQESFLLHQEEISQLAPTTFSETYVRLFGRDKKKTEAIQKAWRNYLRANSGSKPSPQHFIPPQSKLSENSANQFRDVIKKLDF